MTLKASDKNSELLSGNKFIEKESTYGKKGKK